MTLEKLVLLPNKRFVKSDFLGDKTCFQKIVDVGKLNAGNRLKHVLAEFKTDRSDGRGVNGRPKFVRSPQHYAHSTSKSKFWQKFSAKCFVGKIRVLTYVSWLEDISVLARERICLG